MLNIIVCIDANTFTLVDVNSNVVYKAEEFCLPPGNKPRVWPQLALSRNQIPFYMISKNWLEEC